MSCATQILDRLTEDDRLWRVEVNGAQGLVHKGFFVDSPGFAFERQFKSTNEKIVWLID